MTKIIPAQKIFFSKEDRDEILSRINEGLISGRIAQGKNVSEFEECFARALGVKFAIAVSSGGAALELAMFILNVNGKSVLIPTNTFIATASAIIFAGGKPVFVDVSRESFAPSLEQLKVSRTADTVGIIMVHVGGIISPEIGPIREYCQNTGLWLVEDCAHAHGSRYQGNAAGLFGVFGAYSFFATKVITSGEGGMLVTNDEQLATKVRCIRDYGKPEQWISYSTEIGVNRRMSEFCAAVGLVSTRNLGTFVQKRNEIADMYAKLICESSECHAVLPLHQCSWYKFIVIPPLGISRPLLKDSMLSKGIQLAGGVYDLPLHSQPMFKNLPANFPIADDICSRHVCLPIFPEMQPDEVSYVIQGLNDSIKELNS